MSIQSTASGKGKSQERKDNAGATSNNSVARQAKAPWFAYMKNDDQVPVKTRGVAILGYN